MIKNTQSTNFLIRPLGIIKKDEKISHSRIKDFGFVEAFMRDLNHESDYTHPLYLLFKQENTSLSFREFIQREYERGLLLEDYDYPEGYIVLLYDYPEEFKADYEKIAQGKYSETSKEFQNLFPETYEIDGIKTTSMYYKVFKKETDLRKGLEKEYGIEIPEDSELWRAPYIESIPPSLEGKVLSETLDINKYLNG